MDRYWVSRISGQTVILLDVWNRRDGVMMVNYKTARELIHCEELDKFKREYKQRTASHHTT